MPWNVPRHPHCHTFPNEKQWKLKSKRADSFKPTVHTVIFCGTPPRHDPAWPRVCDETLNVTDNFTLKFCSNSPSQHVWKNATVEWEIITAGGETMLTVKQKQIDSSQSRYHRQCADIQAWQSELNTLKLLQSDSYCLHNKFRQSEEVLQAHLWPLEKDAV